MTWKKEVIPNYGSNETYLKGKDIKVPFDCLWHCYTRKFEATIVQPHNINGEYMGSHLNLRKPEEFEKW